MDASSVQWKLCETNGAGEIQTHDLTTYTLDAGALPSLLQGLVSLPAHRVLIGSRYLEEPIAVASSYALN